MADYLPFPTFGGQQQGSGITAVQLPATAMRFPTPNFNPRQREPEPTTKETIAPFMPLITEGIMGLFKDEPEQLTRGEYLKSIAVDPESPTKLEEARADAYSFLGPPEERDTFGLGDIAHLVAASQMGRGADDYAQTYATIRKAREDARRTTESGRASFIKKQIDPPSYQYINVQNVPAARQGITDIRPAKFDPETGQVWVQDPEYSGDVDEDGFRVAGKDWVDPSKLATGDVTGTGVFSNARLIELNQAVQEQADKEMAMGGAIRIAYNTMEELERIQTLAPETQGTTAVGAILNFTNNVRENFEQAFNVINRAGFSQNDVGGSDERPGTGFEAERLWNAITNPNATDQEINAATEAFEESQGTDLRSILGEAAYNNVATRANFLQLAYLAAAANGQTGRTLSDRDLAYHLDIVGIGRTQDPETLGRNLRRFINQTVEKLDSEAQFTIPLYGLGRYQMDNPQFQSVVGMYYVPPTITVKDEETGEDIVVHDWNDHEGYTYKSFFDRHGSVENVSNWQDRYGRFSPDAETPDAEAPAITTGEQRRIRGDAGRERTRILTTPSD